MSLAAIGREIRFRDCSTICQSRRTEEDIEQAAIEGAVQRLRPKLMTVTAVLASLVPILWETGIGSDVMKPIAAPVVGGMITSTIHVLILVPVFFVMMKERALRRGVLKPHGS
jgi:copper/silver efflux system protein